MAKGLSALVTAPLVTVASLFCSPDFAAALELRNELIRAEFTTVDGALANTAVARANGDDRLVMRNDEFELLLFDGSRVTVRDYTVVAAPRVEKEAGKRILRIACRVRTEKSGAPPRVMVTYTLGDGPYVRKAVEVPMERGQDRPVHGHVPSGRRRQDSQVEERVGGRRVDGRPQGARRARSAGTVPALRAGAELPADQPVPAR